MNEEQEYELPPDLTVEDFYLYLPRREYVFRPLPNVMWKAQSVNLRLPEIPLTHPDGTAVFDKDGKQVVVKPTTWIDRHHAIEARSWDPREPEIVRGKLPAESGWIERPGTNTLNTYQPPPPCKGNPRGAKRWRALLAALYPDDAEHICAFFAHTIQFPGHKINHALVLGGPPRVGKDSLIEPLVLGVGAANFKEASPHTILKSDRNDYLCAVLLRISEAKDQGEVNRYALYEKSKTILAAPPHTHRINIKYVPEFYSFNVNNTIYTTNHGQDGLYLPPDDGRHYVANTECQRLPDQVYEEYWHWLKHGMAADVVAYLRKFDLARFNAKAPPRKTPAFLIMTNAGEAPEVAELSDVIDKLGRLETPPAARSDGTRCGPAALTLTMLRSHADSGPNDLHTWLADRRNRRAIPHRLASCGYLPCLSGTKDGFWIINGRREAVYGRHDLTTAQRFTAATALQKREDKKAAENASVTALRTALNRNPSV
jgi:hypothetical protein